MNVLAAALFAGVLAYPHLAIGAQGDCSQPVSSGDNPVASDCLFILNVAVGIQTCTPEACVCDPTGDGNATATDALTCLNKAVSGDVPLLCPCDSVTTTSTTTTTFDSRCKHDGVCNADDDCICPDCDTDLFCSDPSKCFDNGECNTFTEGCVCADCMTHPECLDN
jgi:hypothetical protein